jgi:hypothetical protein
MLIAFGISKVRRSTKVVENSDKHKVAMMLSFATQRCPWEHKGRYFIGCFLE